MTRLLENKIVLTVEATQDQSRRVFVTIMSSYKMTAFVRNGIVLSVITFGLSVLIVAPAFYLKYNRWKKDVQIVIALLKSDLDSKGENTSATCSCCWNCRRIWNEISND